MFLFYFQNQLFMPLEKNYYHYHLLNVFLLHCIREQADLHIYLPYASCTHTHTFMQSPLAGKHTQGPRLTEAAISAQFSDSLWLSRR